MKRETMLLAAALAAGIAIAYLDSRPTWDDTGVTVALILLATGALGFIAPRRPWGWALAVGLWVPLAEFRGPANAASLVAVGVALVGAYGGAAIRRVVTSAPM